MCVCVCIHISIIIIVDIQQIYTFETVRIIDSLTAAIYKGMMQTMMPA